MTTLFLDRQDAGRKLAEELQKHTFIRPLLLALPRGGIPVAHEIYLQTGIPWEILVVRKIGAPGQREYGIGAMSEDGFPFIADSDYLEKGRMQLEVNEIIKEERDELQRRLTLYRHDLPLPDMRDRDVIIVDDGLATGVTATAAAKFVKKDRPHKVILAVPVGPRSVGPYLMNYVDEVICLEKPDNFFAIGSWYKNFGQVSDQEVLSFQHQQVTGVKHENLTRHFFKS